jgi:hypothetical protein
MGPILKKITELSQTEGISEETKIALTMLKNEVKELEPRVINDAYSKGYTDKESNKRPTWDYYKAKHYCYFSEMKLGQLN